jgi:hypothetical protein
LDRLDKERLQRGVAPTIPDALPPGPFLMQGTLFSVEHPLRSMQCDVG